MGKMSVSIMMHPSRTKWKDYLISKLGNVPIAMDDGCGIVENMKKAWRMHDPSANYHLVLNDDAIVCNDFYRRADEILTKESQAYSFYFGTRAKFKWLIDDCYKNQLGYVVRGWLHFGLAICMPTKIIPGLFAYVDKIKDLPPNRNSDTRIARYIKSLKMYVHYPIPSLIDHRCEESIVGDQGHRRVAQYFVGE